MGKILRNKKGSMIILILAVLMCMFIPMIAVIYDIGMMRLYKQDIKNAQEIAGLACIGASTGSINGSGVAAGGFNTANCQRIAKSTAAANLKSKYLPIHYEVHNNSKANASKVENDRKSAGRLVDCKSSRGSYAANFDVKVVSQQSEGAASRSFTVQVVGLCYKPVFIDSKLLNFQVLRNVANKINFRDEYHLEVAPSTFSAVYSSNN